ncbi:MAG: hypothetical protein ACREXY_01440 [Gammaproteobacteria bacterium]
MSTMFVVSCRKDFWSATEFSPTDEIRELDLDNGNGLVITPAAFLGAMAQKRITVLVHGYNNERLDLNTHSLGAHVAFEALREASSQVVRNAWNFASAADNESVEQGERYFDASRQSARFYVFHSKNDPVLRVWYRIGDFFNFDTALGYSGPEDPRAIIDHSQHVTVINCKDVVTSHGGYRSSGQVWSFMAQELTSPTNEQFVTLKKTPEALTAVFRAMGAASTLRRRLLQGVGRRQGVGGKRRRGGARRTSVEAIDLFSGV